MRRLTDISMGSVSTLLPVYSYYPVLVSDTFLDEATNRLSDTFLDEAIRWIEKKKTRLFEIFKFDSINFLLLLPEIKIYIIFSSIGFSK